MWLSVPPLAGILQEFGPFNVIQQFGVNTLQLPAFFENLGHST